MKRLLLVLTSLAATAFAGTYQLANTHWELESYTLNGSSYTAPKGIARPRLSFQLDASSAVGFGGCNQFNARYQAESTTLLVANIVSTKKACRAAANELEARYFQLLGNAQRYTASDRTLLVSSGKGNALLFTRTLMR